MKATVIRVAVANIVHPARRAEVEVLVDTSRMFGILPAALLQSLGVEPVARWRFESASGSAQVRQVADIAVLYRNSLGPTRVIFGEENETPVLGSHALDSLGLRLDPDTGELKPYPLPLYSCVSRYTASALRTSAVKAGDVSWR